MTIDPCGPNCVAADPVLDTADGREHDNCPDPQLCADCGTENIDASSCTGRCATCELLRAQRDRFAVKFPSENRPEYADVVQVLRAVEYFDTWYYECERADGTRVEVRRLWMLPEAVQKAYRLRTLMDVRANLANKPDGTLMRALGVCNDEHSVE